MRRRSRGFTLIETLVALLVLSVALLGAAALQLESLRVHAGALRHVTALGVVRDMADRIHANPQAGVLYDTSNTAPASVCDAAGCSVAQTAGADRDHFTSAARTLVPHGDIEARIEYVPAIGPSTPARYSISLRWSDARDDAGTHRVALQVMAQSPVAG